MRVPEKHLLMFYWLCQSLWPCRSQQTVENSERDGISDHLICLLRSLYAGQEGTVRIGHGTTDWFQTGKGVHQGYKLSHCLFNIYAEYIMWDAWQKKHKLESRLPGERSISSDMQITPPYGTKWGRTKSLLIKVKEEDENVGLKCNI